MVCRSLRVMLLRQERGICYAVKLSENRDALRELGLSRVPIHESELFLSAY